MSWANRSLFAALLLLLARAAWAQTGCVPNPNDNGPPFVNSCPLPPGALNSALAAPSITSLSGVGTPSISKPPTGNYVPTTTLSSMVAQTNTASFNDREFMMSLGLTSAFGDGDILDNDKVTLYAGFVGRSGSADGWAVNHLASASAGFYTGGFNKHTMRTDECDLDNYDVDVPALIFGMPTQFPRGVERPFSACLYISGIPHGTPGAHRNTFAALINSGIWQFGYAVLGNDLSQAAFYDYSNATYGIDIEGSHAVSARFNGGAVSAQFRHGDDMNILIRGPIDLAGGNSISSVNDANNAQVPLEFLSSDVVFNAPVSINKSTEPTVALDVGGAGKFSGTVAAAGFILKHYTADTLPICNSSTKFMMAAVSDLATPPAYSATISKGSGGGAVACPVFCNGTDWTAH
jgi:hypothetical protein